ncbi:MAG TPA: rRNA maturation RNase YbeY [Fimbriimonadaceae bacterium]|nr:rRNA maturation RNase YbeY [Fimbriimonadaceae bacterium]
MEPPSTRVSIVNQSSAKGLSSIVRKAIQTTLGAHDMSGTVSVLLCADLRDLNRQFRGLDESTDVLTFPAPPETGLLGDIAISVDYASEQAKARGITVREEVGYLAMHGALHLVGFDDESDADRVDMQQEMTRLGEILGLPYQSEWASILHEVPS